MKTCWGSEFCRKAPMRSLSTMILCACVAAMVSPAQASAKTREHRAPSTAPYHHLWAVSGGVRSYPLDPDGLPSTVADTILLGGLEEPFDLGFDGAGYLYVTDGQFGVREVKVYAPHSIGNAQPVRTIPVPQQPEWIAVDPTGYVYVTAAYQAIDVFAPGAGPSSQPINVIPVPPSQLFFGLRLDQLGHLYVTDYSRWLWEYDDPIHEQAPDHSFQRPAYFAWPITFDTDDNRVYFRVAPPDFNPWNDSDYAALGPDLQPLPQRGNLWIFSSKVCMGSSSPGGSEPGVAVNTNYLMFACNDSGQIFVYHNHPGRQEKPVEIIDAYAVGIIFGP